jgi:hypothetical protein
MKEYMTVDWGARDSDFDWTNSLNQAARDGWVVQSVMVRETGDPSHPDWVVALMERDVVA